MAKYGENSFDGFVNIGFCKGSIVSEQDLVLFAILQSRRSFGSVVEGGLQCNN